jgi:hypothetical protein
MPEVECSKETLSPFVARHNRYYSFEEFEGLGKAFMGPFSHCFSLYASTFSNSTAQTMYGMAKRFLRFLAENTDSLQSLTSVIHDDPIKATEQDWEHTLALLKDRLNSDSRIARTTKYHYISHLNRLLKKLIAGGVIPEIALLKPDPKARVASRATPCLAELHPPEIRARARKYLDEALSGAAGTAADRRVKEDFLAALLSETGEIEANPEEQAEALFRINRERLELLRSCASKEFQSWRDHWLNGMRLIRNCDLEFDEIASITDRAPRNVRERSKDLNYIFPDDDADLALARFLKYFAAHPDYRGRLPKTSASYRPPRWYVRTVVRFGGHGLVQSYLFPCSALTTAVISMILCDSGANVSVATTLLLDCLEDSGERGYKKLKGNKMRADGKLIVDELPIKDPRHAVSCVEAIQTYQSISERMRMLAPEKVAARLFLQLQQKGSIRNPSNHIWPVWFKAFCSRHPELANLGIMSKMVRSSVLLQASYEKETGIVAAAAIGSHESPSTTFPYVARFPNQALWAEKIRKFQRLFMSVSIQSIEGAAEKLGLSPAEAENLFNEAYRTGLGVVCLNPKAGIQPGTQEGEDCTQIDRCPTCPLCVIVATEENLKDLILFNKHLERHRPEWERDRPERWGKVWLPFLVFTQVSIEQASRGRTSGVFERAKARADEQWAAGDVNLPPLW